MKRNRVTFHLGLGHSYNVSLIEDAQAYLASTFGGFTWLAGTGGWLGPARLEIEPSAYILVYTNDGVTAKDIITEAADWLRVTFAQAEVWYTVESVTVNVSE